MEKRFATVGVSPNVLVEVHGDLSLKGWDEQAVVAKNASAEELSLEQRGDDIVVRCTANCSLRLPRQAVVTIQTVHGNAVIKGLDGLLNVAEVQGDLVLRSVGSAAVNLVGGNLSAKNIFGELALDRVEGNAAIKDVQGDFTVSGTISGNLQLGDTDGNASATVEGNASIRIDPAPGKSYRFHANGDLLVRLPEDASVELLVEAGRGQLHINLPKHQAAESNDKPYRLTLGEGDAQLTLSALGNIVVTSHFADWDFGPPTIDLGAEIGAEFEGMAEAISAQVAQQVEMQMEMLKRQLDAQLAGLSSALKGGGLSPEQAERISQRARAAAERAAARAQERMAAAQERMQRKIEAARRAEQRARYAQSTAPNGERRAPSRERTWRLQWSGSKAQADTVSDPVSDDERMMILQMLEQKKISIEEAEALLSALEGKE